MKIGIVACDGNEKWMSCYESISNSCFKRAGDAELVWYHAWRGDLPTIDNTRHLDALVCLGSAHCVRENTDWMVDLSNFFLSLENSHIKVLAICFSHQLVNKAYRGTVEKAQDYGFIFGANQITFRDDINMPSGFRRLVEKYADNEGTLQWNMLESHLDEVTTLGEGATLVASSKRCRNEIVLVRDNILSMQCHPDLTPQLMMEKIWPAIIRKGHVIPESEMDVLQEMTNLDTVTSLDFIRDFFRS